MVTSLSNAVVTILLNNILMRLAGSDGVASITIILYTRVFSLPHIWLFFWYIAYNKL